ncbi:MAG: hypothetical protein KDC99_19145 [Cyclobacteriaceae bacterium]|nr:hypothetical protein [Cyclobacteriaceae bacterium]
MFYALLRAGEIEIWRFVEGVFGIGPLFLQFLNGIAAYFLIPFLVRTEKDRKIFLGVLVLAGLFPLTTGLLQIGGFIEGRTIRTTGDLIRISGLYYDSTNMRMYSLQTLVAIVGLLFYSKDSIRSRWNWKYAGMLIMIPLLLIVIYYGYSKAAVAIVLSWTVLLCLFKLKSVYLILFVTGLSVLFTTIDETPLALDRLFHKEISFAEGTLAEENEYTLLGGRFKRWEDYLSRFSDADLMDKLLCVQYSIGIMAHNDFVRVLIGTGVLGLLSYSWVLLSIIRRVVSEAITSKTGLSISALMILVSFLIDSLGLVPLIYPGYCWVTFGLISLSLNRNLFANDFQTDKKKNE